MSHYDRRLVRPSVNDLVTALDDATRAASVGGAVFGFEHAHWQAFVGDIRGEREGVREWRHNRGVHNAGVGLAWWTDALGRRHFRVWGVQEWPANRELRPRPAVWLMAPDRILSRQRGSRTDWLALCECGACGSPEAIGWVGDRCGTCHQATRSFTTASGAIFRDARLMITEFAFSPDGQTLAGAGRGAVHLWDVPARAYRGVIETSDRSVRTLRFSPDGCHLLVGDSARMLRWIDWRTREETASLPTPRSLHFAALTEDGRMLVMAGTRDWEVWARSPNRPHWRIASQWEAKSKPGCVSLWQDALAISDGEEVRQYRFIDSVLYADWGVRCGAANQYISLAHCPYGAVLACQGVRDRSGGSWLQLCGARDGKVEWQRATDFGCLSPVASPDGDLVAGMGKANLYLEPIANGADHTTLQADGRTFFTALAFSPDDETLAVASAGTVRLWPWRQLLAV